ncbi:hypothetical protein XH94_19100 [Bradyrhizobium zhanjiangense]|uniref:Uncharacterized protein n=2 Tax=Bradyrhizobium zhanjiangense TaxID=1325107 RepID=A0A4Q0SKG2_9BRAD|nr:hypothetical protein XH94_19100 [Bradyrhizobium zhanjiangense]
MAIYLTHIGGRRFAATPVELAKRLASNCVRAIRARPSASQDCEDPVRWRGDDGTLRKVVVLQDRVLNRAAEKMMLAGNIEKFSLQLVAVR